MSRPTLLARIVPLALLLAAPGLAAQDERQAPLAGAEPKLWGGPAIVQIEPAPADEWRAGRRITLACFEGTRGDPRDATSVVRIRLERDGGSIAFNDRYARMMGGGQRGWYPLTGVVRGADGFSARFRTARFSKARVSYDRASGRVRVRGATDFSGPCVGGARGDRW